MQKIKDMKKKIVKKEKLDEVLDTTIEKKEPKKPEIEMVKGVFKNLECEGADVKFSYARGKEVPKKYVLQDGEVYELPIDVARHINRCGHPVNEAEVDKHGNYLGRREKFIRRFDFRRIDDLLD